jgi:hypothetical protein
MLKKNSLFIVFMLLFIKMGAQELNCTIDVNSAQVTGTNKQVFQTLKNSLIDFVNKKQWTTKVYKQNERVDCGITIIITSQSSNSFTGTLQVNAVRPIYGSSYKSPIFNFKDSDISFDYTEFEPLNFNATVFESNLVSLISFYVYTILGVDADTFSLKGGEEYFKMAMDIANLAQQGGVEGWIAKRNQLNRYSLIDQLTSTVHEDYREAMYLYHRKGFDLFSEKPKDAKKQIYDAILLFEELNVKDRNSFLIRTFFDAKSDEIVEVFKEKDNFDASKLKPLLTRISAVNNTKWKKIK